MWSYGRANDTQKNTESTNIKKAGSSKYCDGSSTLAGSHSKMNTALIRTYSHATRFTPNRSANSVGINSAPYTCMSLSHCGIAWRVSSSIAASRPRTSAQTATPRYSPVRNVLE